MTGFENRIELRGVMMRFGDVTAVAPLDLGIRHGEFVALLGPAGAGKSTTLRLIAGLERPMSGTIFIDGLEVTPLPAQRRNVAFLFQPAALYPHLSVERNIAFPLRAQHVAPHATTRRVDEVIARLHLDGLRRVKPRKLTPSEYQRASLARAMVRDPNAFLLDDPVVPFEAEHRDATRQELRAIHDELRATTVLATRDPLDAITTADRIVVMNEGRVVQCDTPQAVYDRPADLFVARFLGAAAMNFLEARRIDGVVQLVGSDVSFRVDDGGAQPVDSGKITLGIRPEHIRVHPQGVPASAIRSPSPPPIGTMEVRLGDVTLRTLAAPLSGSPGDGESVPIRLDPAGCRWFDATSGKALPWRTLQ